MRYRTQAVAYPYFVVALLLYGLQMAFGLLSAAKYLGPDPLINLLPFDVTKAIHTNLLIVWVLTGFMGAAYWLVPEESRTELHSPKMAYVALGLWTVAGVTAVVGYLFGWTAGNKLLEQPLPVKLAIVVVMLMFLYNLGMTIWKAKRLTTTEGVLMAGLALTAILYLPSLLEFDNYTVAIFYRWWTVHLWVEGVWEMIQGALLAYLLIRLSGVDREVMEKWLYVIVGLTFISGLLGTAHHYYFVGVPSYWLPLGGFFSALEPLVFVAMSAYAYQAIRRSGSRAPEHAGPALDARERDLLGARRRPARARAHLAGCQQVDARDAHHADARPRGLLRRLRDDRPGRHHLRHAGAHGTLRVAARDEDGTVGVLAAGGRHVRDDDGVCGGRDRTGVSRADPRAWLSRDAGEDPGALPDARRHGDALQRRRGAVPVGLLLPGAASACPCRGGRADGSDTGMSDRHMMDGRPRALGEPLGGERHDGLRYPGPEAPFYLPTGGEIAVFEACHARGLPVMLKGPTGCGKTRFVEHMAWRLGRPLVTVACHDDLVGERPDGTLSHSRERHRLARRPAHAGREARGHLLPR